jgi:hypothetical protein
MIAGQVLQGAEKGTGITTGGWFSKAVYQAVMQEQSSCKAVKQEQSL